MIAGPPGEPSAATAFPSASKAITGVIELRGRFPGATALATGTPSRSGRNEKSVS
jgi:hypothetical protein